MNITIQKSKNGEDTAIADNHFLHSNYAPVKEAERYIENLSCTYDPIAVVITEPALSYIISPLRKKYPEARIGVIRYSNYFQKYNFNFDFIINFYETKSLETQLERLFTEEELLSVFFISWKPSEIVFKEQNQQCWLEIKNTLERAKTLLITRQYFEKKWLVNCAKFLRFINYPVKLQKNINKPVMIITSGPSLKDAIQDIKKVQDKFFIICLSSAISVCLKNQIIPDLCMTSDGGYWAGQHLKKLVNNDVVLAMPTEALCPVNILSKQKILPLNYVDGISNELSNASGLSFSKAVRNGTISGTAILWAIENSNQDIFIFGMDLANQKGFQHTQPNEIETNASLFDNRIKTKEKRIAVSEFSGASLEIYRSWFSNYDFKTKAKKIYRVINQNYKKNSLGQIKDISVTDLKKIALSYSDSEKISYFESQKKATISAGKKASLYFEQNFQNELWKKQLFPLDYVLLSHEKDKNNTSNKIEKNYLELGEKIKKILYE